MLYHVLSTSHESHEISLFEKFHTQICLRRMCGISGMNDGPTGAQLFPELGPNLCNNWVTRVRVNRLCEGLCHL